jgi:acetyltransferase
MTVRNLDRLFRPASVAVVGASPRTDSVGGIVMRNVVAGGFKGPVLPINPRHAEVAGLKAYARVAELPLAPDLAVICTPPATVPELVAELGARGTRAAVVITAGLGGIKDEAGVSLQDRMLQAARPNLFRILGPNCVGLIVPGIALNASFAHLPAAPGRLAFVSQSGALCTAVLDWAHSRGIGFSHFVSLGNSADVDFGDVIDYLANDPGTDAILLYIEAVTAARKFMSAARAAARTKPVIAIKAGRVVEGARAALSHTGAMAGADDVYDAAIRRAGALRVYDIDELFDAVETLAYARALPGERLAILTNGGGPGVLATDALVASGGTLAKLEDATIARLDAVLPANWSRANPVDIIGDAGPERFRAATELLLSAPEADAILFAYAPTATADPNAISAAVVEAMKGARRPVFATWLGGRTMDAARARFAEAGIPTYDTPEKAARAFLHLVSYRRSQAALMRTPPAAAAGRAPDAGAARRVIAQALAEGRTVLSEPESKGVLAAYGIPVVATRSARDTDEAARLAAEIGYPVALKLLSPDVSHKSDVGGVVLDLPNEAALRAAAKQIHDRLAELRPGARLAGYSVQEMARRPGAHELIVGATVDATFGPVVLFGQGGTAAEVIGDRAVALPPLDALLARDLVSRTRIAKLLAGYRDRPAADLDAICGVLVRLSQLVADMAEVCEIDINPLYADAQGVVALDARMRIAPAPEGDPTRRLAIRPYPQELEETITIDGRPVVLRPIRPEDEPAHRAFLATLSPADVRFRFFGMVRDFRHDQLARWTQIDYDREMAFIAAADGRTLGVVRTVTDPDNQRAEFAIVVAGAVQNKGLGHALMSKMIAYARARGTELLAGQVMADNERMLGLMRTLGFTLEFAGHNTYDARLRLAA